jgi:hypothetical protein
MEGKMKRNLRLFFYLVFMFIFLLSFSKDRDISYTLTMYVGDVKVSMDNSASWIPAKADMKLKENSIVKTGRESSCDIMIPKKGMFRIVENSLVVMSKIREKLEEIKIKKGKVLFSITGKIKDDEKFSIHTEVAIASVRGTKFIIQTDEKKVKCSVAEGSVVIRRNITLPVEIEDEEITSKLEVVAGANQEIELTMDENKALENLLNRVKDNMNEFKRILSQSQRETQKKVRMIKNVRRVLEELHQFEEVQNQNETQEVDETEELIERVKQK